MATRIDVSSEEQPRIIVDCTHTYHTGAFTGIQRVVRHFADGLLKVAGARGIDVVPVRVAGAAFVPLPLEGARVAFPRSKGARETSDAGGPPRRLLALRAIGHRINAILRSNRLRDWLDAGPNQDGLARRVAASSPVPRPADALEISRDDIVLSLDSSWVYDIRTALDAAGRAGATRVAVVCDVLPLSHPQWFTEGTRRWFRGWLEVLLPRLEGIVAISRASCSELRTLVEGRAIRTRSMPPCTAVHLGAEIDDGAQRGEIRGVLRDSMGPGRVPAFLTVGTLEPRKNVAFALDLFDELAARGLDFQWHIVGAPGWLTDETERRIQEHPQHGHRLHWWTDLGDSELAWCYRNAAALVAVSKAEGFGLPIVEARLQGLPVFASDIPVFREVLESEGRYLPLSNARLAAAALEDFLTRTDSTINRPSTSSVARSWQEAARELLDTVLGMHRARR